MNSKNISCPRRLSGGATHATSRAAAVLVYRRFQPSIARARAKKAEQIDSGVAHIAQDTTPYATSYALNCQAAHGCAHSCGAHWSA